MKRLILLFLAITFISISAQDPIKLNGQIRARTIFDNRDFNSNTAFNNFTELRTRLGAMFSPAKNISAFIQIQDSRVYGTEPTTLSNTTNLDLHQAHFTFTDFLGLPLDVKAGRMEVNFGPQRLVGAVGWSNVGRSFDGGIATLKFKDVDFQLFGFQENEEFLPSDSLDKGIFGVYSEISSIKNYSVQPFFIMENVSKTDDLQRFTTGFYIKGSAAGFFHELEFAYQFGDMKGVDIKSMMAAINVGYKFKSKVKPVVSVGLDMIGGDKDLNDNETNSFHTLYATNHKYYGYMDYFLNLPVSTGQLGLNDFQGLFSISPIEKLTLIAEFHLFNSNKSMTKLDGTSINNFGSELDITGKYAYSKGVTLQGGFSFFSPGDLYELGGARDTSLWGYMMAVVNF